MAGSWPLRLCRLGSAPMKFYGYKNCSTCRKAQKALEAMGYAIAEAACVAGHEVVLVSGPVTISAPLESGVNDRV